MIKNLTVQVLIAGVLAFLLAWLFGDPSWSQQDAPPAFYEFILLLKSVFLGALRMLIAPLIFFSLIGGISGIGSIVKLRSMGGITVSYYLLTTSIAILLALFAVFFVHPWTSYPPAINPESVQFTGTMINANSHSTVAIFQNILQQAFTNPFTALTELNILGIVTNAFLIGLAMVIALPSESPLFKLIDDINKVISRILGWIIKTLPIGIFAIIFDFALKLNTGEGHAPEFLAQLFSFALLVVILTLVHGALILPAIAAFFTGANPFTLIKNISRPLLVAFSTSSSSATLPVSMKCCDENLNIDKGVSGFVLPLGATMNMDGTALFEAVAAIFLAYLYGIELGTSGVLVIFFITMLASIGAPGIPSASMAGMQMVLLAAGIPLEAIAILLVIERPLDTIRTAVNVEGDLIGCLVVQNHLRSDASS